MNSFPKPVTQQCRYCDLNPGPSVPESSTLTTLLPSHPLVARNHVLGGNSLDHLFKWCRRLQMPNKAQLEADHHQRLTTRFSLRDAANSRPLTAHQTFVRLMNVKTKQEVIYVAEEDSAGAYRFELVGSFSGGSVAYS